MRIERTTDKNGKQRLRQNLHGGHLERQNPDVQNASMAHRRDCELPEGGDREEDETVRVEFLAKSIISPTFRGALPNAFEQ